MRIGAGSALVAVLSVLATLEICLAGEPLPVPPTIKTSAGPAAKSTAYTELPLMGVSPNSARPPDASAVRMYRARASDESARGDWAASEETLRAAFQLDPRNADVVLDLYHVLLEQGKEEAALVVLVGYSGSDARVTQALGEAYVRADRLKEAEQVFMDLSLRQPAEAFHRYNLGLVEAKMLKFDMAENAYLRSIELDPKFADARYNLALLYIRRREFPKALAQLEEAVRLRSDPDYLINYGVVLRELNRFPVSKAALEKALQMSPSNVLAMNNLALTLYEMGSKEDARRVLQDVLNLSPDDPTARSFLAKLSSEPPAAMGMPADGRGRSTLARVSATPQPAIAPGPKLPEKSYESPIRDAPSGSPSVDRWTAEMEGSSQPKPALAAPEDISSDLDRLRGENRDLKDKLGLLEKQMEEMKSPSYRVSSALKRAQDQLEKIEKKERDLPPRSPAVEGPPPTEPAMVGPAAVAAGSPSSGALEQKIEQLQKVLADLKSEMDGMRRAQGPAVPTFAPEPGSTQDRLDAADRTIQQLQRQVRQITLERDMLRSEVDSIRPDAMSIGGPLGSSSPGRVNVNLADLGNLMRIPGMEERLAHSVLWYRQNIGPFQSVADLKKVPGVSDIHYARMVDHVTVGPEAPPRP